MIRVPFYMAIVIVIAFLLNRVPVWFGKKKTRIGMLLIAGYTVVNLGITLVFRLLAMIFVKPIVEQHLAENPWVPDPTAPVIVGQKGSTWLAQEQGIGGLRLLWIALSDSNSMLYIIPSCILNILFFMPVGMILPCLIVSLRNNKKACVLIGFIWSLLIEILQTASGLGMGDVRDLICNTLGTLFGFLVWKKFIEKNW